MDGLQMKMRGFLAFDWRLRSSSRTRRVSRAAPAAPHAIRAGQEGAICPITGLRGDGSDGAADGRKAESAAAFAAMEADPDITEERNALAQKGLLGLRASAPPRSERAEPLPLVPLNVIGGTHNASHETRCLVIELGGLARLRKFTGSFYEKAFADPHLDKFIHSHEDAHGERFATWIAEKFGDGTPWTNERRTRKPVILKIDGRAMEVAYDRSSAHLAAWYSPKREPQKVGQHFKPEDARVWMRLHFWAARETGLFEPEHAAFMDYYVRFIAHFMSIYSSKAPPFTRESARWSADSRNIERYLSSGRVMRDVIGKPVEEGLAALPPSERAYTGSRSHQLAWPYEVAPLR